MTTGYLHHAKLLKVSEIYANKTSKSSITYICLPRWKDILNLKFRNLYWNIRFHSCRNKPYDLVNRLIELFQKVTQMSHSTTGSQIIHWYSICLKGTWAIHRNRVEIPKIIFQIHNKETYSPTFGFQKHVTLASHKIKKNKLVLILSTLHHIDKIDSKGSIWWCMPIISARMRLRQDNVVHSRLAYVTSDFQVSLD